MFDNLSKLNLNLPLVICLVVVGFIVDIIFIIFDGKNSHVLATVLKGMASLFFVLLGAYCITVVGFNFTTVLVIIGLILGLIGDVFLHLKNCVNKSLETPIFVVGTCSFMLGHFAYIVALALAGGTNCLIAFGVSAILYALVAIPSLKVMNAPKNLLRLGEVYIGVVVYMFSLSLVRFVRDVSEYNLLFMIGALLFTTSDVILCHQMFGTKKFKYMSQTLLILYYTAQMLIAFSCLLY